MKYLLDTHLLLWAAGMPEKLPSSVRTILNDPAVTPIFSAASIWDVAIKKSLNRPDFRVEPGVLRRGLIDNGYEELAISGIHASSVDGLPPIHKDPFDRLLVAQAVAEGIILLTVDTNVVKYPGPIQAV